MAQPHKTDIAMYQFYIDPHINVGPGSFKYYVITYRGRGV